MAQTKPIPVRLSNELIDRLDRAAKAAHLSNRTEVIKLCISSFLDYFEAHGKASLPLDWEEMLASLDGRTRPGKVLHLDRQESAMVAESEATYGIKKENEP